MLGRFAGLGAATAATAAASVAWLTLGPGPQRPARKSAATAETPGRGLIVCVGEDTILRAMPASLGCLPGQVPLPLEPMTNTPDPLNILDLYDDDDSKPASSTEPPTANADLLTQLEQRVGRLRRSPLFTVVDKDGQPLFSVRPGAVLEYNASGAAVAAIRATEDGGFFRSMASDASVAVSTGVGEWRAGLTIKEGEASKVELGRQPAGNFALKFVSTSPADEPIAGIGEARGGAGALAVGPSGGQRMASLSVDEGRGAFSIFSRGGTNIATLRQSEAGGGILILGDGGGRQMVKMVVNDDRYGAVLTGPGAGFPFIPASGLPGSYFFGCAGGARCYGY